MRSVKKSLKFVEGILTFNPHQFAGVFLSCLTPAPGSENDVLSHILNLNDFKSCEAKLPLVLTAWCEVHRPDVTAQRDLFG